MYFTKTFPMTFFLKIVNNNICIILLFKNHCQLNLKTIKMVLVETGKVDFWGNRCRPSKYYFAETIVLYTYLFIF